MIGEEGGLLKLIAAVHSGAASAERWTSALDSLSDAMGGSPLLIGSTPHTAGGFRLAGHRMDPQIVALVNGPLATRQANPVFCSVPRAPIHQPLIISSVLEDRLLLGSRVYHEALKPSGIRYSMAVVLSSDDREAVTLSLGRSSKAGDFERRHAQLLGLLAPHLQSALAVQRELAVARAGAASLDALERGVMLVGADCCVRFANREAERILDAADGLSGGATGLRAARTDQTARLRSMIVEAAAASEGRASGAGGVLSVSRPSLAPPYAVHVLPAGLPLHAAYGLGPQPLAAVFVRDPERRPPPPAELLRGLYGLSQAEAALALEIYEGLSLTEAAERLRVSANTAKTQLKAVFEKVGVSRQSGLVRALAVVLGELSLPRS